MPGNDNIIEERNPDAINISGTCNQNCIFCSGYERKEIPLNETKELITKTISEWICP